MAELGVGTLNMTITADGSAAVAEIDRVKSAAEGVQSSLSGIGGGSADFSGVADGAGEAATGLDKVKTAAPGAASGLEKAGNAANGAKSQMQTLGEQMTKVGKTMSTFATTSITAALTACVKSASDLTETLGKAQVTFGDYFSQVSTWADTAIEKMGLAKGSALEYASTFGDMASGMGLTQSAAASMATSLTQLAADLASFKNISTEVAAQKLTGVFTGETEALKSLGIVMTQTNLNAYAMSQGITQSVSSMSQAEQVALRYKYVLSVTKNAQGDFERTGDSLANQSRKLTQTIKQLGESFGTQLTPLITPVVTKLSELVQSFSNLSDGAKNTIIAIAAVVAAVGPALVIGGKVLALIASLKVALAALTVGQLGVIVATLALAVAGFVTLKSALDGASSSATETSDAYKRMKAALDGDIESEVNITLGEDGSEAKAAVNEMKSLTASPIEGEVDIELGEDGTSAKDAITDLSDMTASPIVATVTADAKPSLDAAKQAVHDLKGTHFGKVEIDGDTVDIDADIENIKTSLEGLEGEVTVTADGSAVISNDGTGIIDQIQEKIRNLRATIPLVADEAKRDTLEKQLSALQDSLDALSSGASITIDSADLEKLTGGEAGEVTVSVVVNGAEDLSNAKTAADELAAMDGETVSVTGEATELTELITSIQDGIKSLSGEVVLTASGDTLMTADQQDALVAIQGKIDALKAKIPLEADETKRAALETTLSTLQTAVDNLNAGVNVTVSYTETDEGAAAKAQAFAEAVAQLPENKTYSATGEFSVSETTQKAIDDYTQALLKAADATDGYKSAVESLNSATDAIYDEKVASVYAEQAAELVKLQHTYESGKLPEEEYDAAIQKTIDDAQKQIDTINEQRAAQKALNETLKDGTKANDAAAVRQAMGITTDGTGVTKAEGQTAMQRLQIQKDQGGDMSEVKAEGATALASALSTAAEQYQALTTAKAEYDASMAQAAQTESNAQAKYEQTTDELTKMKAAAEEYNLQMSNLGTTGEQAMAAIDMSGWDASTVEKFTAAVTNADGTLNTYEDSFGALKAIEEQMAAAEKEYTDAMASASSTREQAISQMQAATEAAQSAGALGENTSTAELEGLLDTVTQTGTAVSEAETTVVTGVQGMLDGVSSALSSENPMEALEQAFSDTSALDAAMEATGQNINQGLANGMGDTSAVTSAGTAVGTAATDAVDSGAGCASPSTITEATGKNVVQGLANGMGDTGAVTSAGTALGSAAVSAAQSAVSSGESAASSAGTAIGTSMMSSAASGATGAASSLTGAVSGAVSSAASGAASSASNSGKAIGTALISGASAGVKAAASSLASAAAAAVKSAVSAAKSAAGISSPSKVMKREVGVMMPRGAVEGIEEETEKLLPRVQSATRKLITGASSTVRGTTFTLPAGNAPAIDYRAMGTAMKDAVSGVQFGFSVGDKELAQATRTATSREQAMRARQVSRGYGG